MFKGLFLFVFLSFLTFRAGDVQAGAPEQRQTLSLLGGVRMGASFQEQSWNYREYAPGFVVGPHLAFHFVHTRHVRLGVDGGYLFFARDIDAGTDMLRMETRYHRFDLNAVATVEFRAFAAGISAGTGIMLFSTDTRYEEEDRVELREHTGVQAGFLGGLSLGAEVGRHWWKLNRSVYLMARSDWLRRGGRDEFTLCFLASIEITSKKKTQK